MRSTGARRGGRSPSAHETNSNTEQSSSSTGRAPLDPIPPKGGEEDQLDADAQRAALERQEGETSAEYLTRLRAIKDAREIERDIEITLRLLQGTGIPEEAGSSQPTHKRVASSALEGDRSKSLKISGEMPTFDGRGFKDLTNFQARWDAIFDAQAPTMADETRIRYAVQGLRDRALQEWNARPEPKVPEGMTFAKWVESLRNSIVDPANRIASLTLKRKLLTQGEKQTSKDMLVLLRNIQNELPGLTPEEEACWEYANILRPDLRNALIRDFPEMNDINKAADTALRVEGLLQRPKEKESSSSPYKGKGKERALPTRPSSDPPAASSSSSGAGRGQKGQRFSTIPQAKGKDTCWSCGKQGHLKAACPKQANSSKGAGDEPKK